SRGAGEPRRQRGEGVRRTLQQGERRASNRQGRELRRQERYSNRARRDDRLPAGAWHHGRLREVRCHRSQPEVMEETMTYDVVAKISQVTSLLLFMALFAGVIAYVFWPGNKA